MNNIQGVRNTVELTLFWGLVTQCLTWADVLNFSWVAMWVPLLIACGIDFIIFCIYYGFHCR